MPWPAALLAGYFPAVSRNLCQVPSFRVGDFPVCSLILDDDGQLLYTVTAAPLFGLVTGL